MSTAQAIARRTLVQKLGYGQGSLYSTTKADGSTVYVHVYSDNGKQREVRLSATSLSAARKECSSRNTRKDEGRLVAPTTITFGEVADEFLTMQRALVEEGRRSRRTVELYEQRYKNHLADTLGPRRFQQVTPQHLSAFLNQLRQKKGVRGNLSSNTRNGILRLVTAIFSFGVARGYRADSPVQYLASQERPAAKPATKARALTDEECSRLIASVRPGLRNLVAVLAFTGLRMSEALGLTWGNVNLDEGTLTVTAQLDRWKKNEAPRLRQLKSENGYRTVDLHPDAVALLREHRRNALSKGQHASDSFVFVTGEGRPLSHRNTARDIEKAAKKAGLNGDGLRPLSAHMLRHTHTSRLIGLGLDVVEVARQIGDRPETIMRVYAHALNDAKRRDEVRQKIAAGTSIALGGGAIG